MPSVACIDDQVFCQAANVVRHSDGTYYIEDNPSASIFDAFPEQTRATSAFVGQLRAIAFDYFNDYVPTHRPNYEDVANFARQISDAISGNFDNPALTSLLRNLQAELTVDKQGLKDLADEAHNYILDVVWRLLSRPLSSLDHLGGIVESCRELDAVDIFDLNHDRVLGTALACSGVAVSDGFTRIQGDVCFWSGEFDQRRRHLKLHGSVDWFRRTLPEEAWRGHVAARSTTGDPYHERDATGELHGFPALGRPMILVGTFDKPLSYDQHVFADQHFFFHASLRSLERLVVIGYGFADKGINTRLIDWLLGDRGRRLVVVHGDEERLVSGARSAVAMKWEGWKQDGRLVVLPRWVADATWAEIHSVCVA